MIKCRDQLCWMISFVCLSSFPRKQLGTGDTVDRPSPTVVAGLPSGTSVTQIACGASHTVVMLNSSAIYVWVRGDDGKPRKLDLL